MSNGIADAFNFGAELIGGNSTSQAHDDELKEIREMLAKKVQSTVYQSAYKEATAELQEELLAEISSLKSGESKTRRLSDPNNAGLRNSELAEKSAKHLARLSGGRQTMTRPSIDRLKNQRLLP